VLTKLLLERSQRFFWAAAILSRAAAEASGASANGITGNSFSCSPKPLLDFGNVSAELRDLNFVPNECGIKQVLVVVRHHRQFNSPAAEGTTLIELEHVKSF
jgi:hypothetical protein